MGFLSFVFYLCLVLQVVLSDSITSKTDPTAPARIDQLTTNTTNGFARSHGESTKLRSHGESKLSSSSTTKPHIGKAGTYGSKPTSTPISRVENPDHLYGKPSNHSVKPSNHSGKPSRHDEKPTGYSGRPKYQNGKPNGYDGKSPRDGKPNGYDGKQDRRDGKQDHRDGKQDHRDGKQDRRDGKQDRRDGKQDHRDGKQDRRDGKQDRRDGKPDHNGKYDDGKSGKTGKILSHGKKPLTHNGKPSGRPTTWIPMRTTEKTNTWISKPTGVKVTKWSSKPTATKRPSFDCKKKGGCGGKPSSYGDRSSKGWKPSTKPWVGKASPRPSPKPWGGRHSHRPTSWGGKSTYNHWWSPKSSQWKNTPRPSVWGRKPSGSNRWGGRSTTRSNPWGGKQSPRPKPWGERPISKPNPWGGKHITNNKWSSKPNQKWAGKGKYSSRRPADYAGKKSRRTLDGIELQEAQQFQQTKVHEQIPTVTNSVVQLDEEGVPSYAIAILVIGSLCLLTLVVMTIYLLVKGRDF